MLIIPSEETAQRLQDVMAFAMRVGALDNLLARLHYLANYGQTPGEPDRTRCTLFYDWAPHSFGFSIEKAVYEDKKIVWKPMIGGGLIYSGPGEDKDAPAPAFEAGFEPEKAAKPHSWGVHT